MRIAVLDAKNYGTMDLETGYKAIAKAGFEAVDWSFYTTPTSKQIREMEYKGSCIFEKDLESIIAHFTPELRLIKENGLSIAQAHAPFPSYVFEHPEESEALWAMFAKCIELCQYAGCPYLVVHSVSLPADANGQTFRDIDDINWRLYTSLIPTLSKCRDVKVCLENMFIRIGGRCHEGNCSDAHEAAQLIDSLNREAGFEAFGFCMDIGHLQLLGKDIRSYTAILGDRIKCLHIHDNAGYDDNHMAPFAGIVDWEIFCQALADIGYRGDLSFETVSPMKRVQRFDDAMIQPWLDLICKTGEVFRRKIQEKMR